MQNGKEIADKKNSDFEGANFQGELSWYRMGKATIRGTVKAAPNSPKEQEK